MKPIIFTGHRAGQVHRGEKTMTRRVVKQNLTTERFHIGYAHQAITGKDGEVQPSSEKKFGIWCDDGEWGIVAPYQAGELLWVREEWWFREDDGITAYDDGSMKLHPTAILAGKIIPATCVEPEWPANASKFGFVKKSPLFMPRWASRTTLEVTEVRAERLQDISEADALAEGIKLNGFAMRMAVPFFRCTWNDVHHKHPENQWEANPWVWVIAFKRVSE